MSKIKDLKLPVTILHEMDNVQYKISATLVDINESMDTCTLEFNNGRIEKDIPMSDVYITEGIIDTIKNFGKKFTSWIVKKVKGFMAILNDDGEIDENSFCTPVNFVAMQAKGQLPKGLHFSPSEYLVEQAEEIGIKSVSKPSDDVFSEAIDKDCEGAETFWKRIMNLYGSTDKSLKESAEYVKQKYYSVKDFRNSINESRDFKNNINEKINSLTGVPDASGRTDLFGNTVDAAELKNVLKKYISAQLNLWNEDYINNSSADDIITSDMIDPDDDSEEAEKEREYFLKQAEKSRNKRRKNIENSLDSETKKYQCPLIWGAPGIGKTYIIKKVVNDIKNDEEHPRQLYMYAYNCAGTFDDSFILPHPEKLERTDQEILKDIPKSWLPVYEQKDKEYNKKMERRFATCMHLTSDNSKMVIEDDPNAEYQGGILFLDEIVRADERAVALMMNLADRGINGMKLAKSWVIIAAANRPYDSPDQSAQYAFINDIPNTQRYIHYLYVPTKIEWLEWARSICDDEKSERYGMSMIDPLITDFIEAIPGDAIWYSTLTNGAYNDQISKLNKTQQSPELDNLLKSQQANSSDEVNSKLNYETIKSLASGQGSYGELAGDTVHNGLDSWNGRSWERISNLFTESLKELFGYKYIDMLNASIDIYNYGGLYPNMIRRNIANPKIVSDKHFDNWCEKYLNKKQFAEYKEELDNTSDGHLSSNARYKYVMYALVYIIKQVTNGEGTYASNKFEGYIKWMDIFTRKGVIDSIYSSGMFPEGLMRQCDLREPDTGVDPKDKEVIGYEWKLYAATIKKVINLIINRYPGGTEKAKTDFEQYTKYLSDMVNSQDFAKLKNCNNEVQMNALVSSSKLFKKIMSSYNEEEFYNYFKVNTADHNKPVELNMLDFDSIKETLIPAILFNVIKNCIFVEHILNVTKYIINIDITGGKNNSDISTFADSTSEFYRQLLTKTYKIGDDLKIHTDYDNALNAIVYMNECYDPNLNDKLNNTFYNIGLLNCFYLFKRCFEYVNGTFHKKTNGKFISSLKFTN